MVSFLTATSVIASVRAPSRRRLDFFVLVLSATVLVLDGCSNGSKGIHWSRRLQWLRINTRDRYTVSRRVRVPLIRIRGFPEYEYEYETEHEQHDAPKPSAARVDLRGVNPSGLVIVRVRRSILRIAMPPN
jgi:hypothetical protein